MGECQGCSRIIYNKDLGTNLDTAPEVHASFPPHRDRETPHAVRRGAVGASATPRTLRSTNPLRFTDTKPYKARLDSGRAATGQRDTVIVKDMGRIEGMAAIAASMEYNFIGGSVGVVVGEEDAQCNERAIDTREAVVIISCSGGARMMEGTLSLLMQMAKISPAHSRASIAPACRKSPC